MKKFSGDKENIIRIILLCVLITGFLIVKTDIGVKGENVVWDARKMQNIPEEYLHVGHVSENLAGYIFYDEDKSDCTFSVYINHPGFSFGYYFRMGGSHYEISEGIVKYKNAEINEVIYMSLNRVGAVNIKIDDGNSVKVSDLTDGPFVFILPANAGEVRFYDAEGNIIPYNERKF